MPRTEAMKRAQHKYQQKTVKTIGLKLHNSIDADIIEYLDGVKSKQGQIKQLIRKEIYKDEYSEIQKTYEGIISGEIKEYDSDAFLMRAHTLTEKGVIPPEELKKMVKALDHK